MTDVRVGKFYVAQSRSGRRHFIHEAPLWGNPQDMERDNIMDITATPTRGVTPDASWPQEERIAFWNAYLDARTGTYEFRCRRYDAVIDKLRDMGMRQADTILDIGAGRMEFAKRLRERDHLGFYIPVDGSIDGTDLDTWEPADHVDWAVGIEVIEHVHDPQRILAGMWVAARFGVVVTTPDTDTLGEEFVLNMDPTHVAPVGSHDLGQWGYTWERHAMFTPRHDTLLAWRGRRLPSQPR